MGKPSSCLSVLQRTSAKVGVGEEFVRHKFISSLPANITPVLAASSTMSLAQLGTLADNLVAFSKCNPVSHVQKHEFPSSSNAPNRHRPSFNSGAGVRPFHESQRPRICRSHIYYAKDARTCRSWCQWPDKQSCKIQPNSRPNSPAPGGYRHPNEQGTL